MGNTPIYKRISLSLALTISALSLCLATSAHAAEAVSVCVDVEQRSWSSEADQAATEGRPEAEAGMPEPAEARALYRGLRAALA